MTSEVRNSGENATLSYSPPLTSMFISIESLEDISGLWGSGGVPSYAFAPVRTKEEQKQWEQTWRDFRRRNQDIYERCLNDGKV